MNDRDWGELSREAQDDRETRESTHEARLSGLNLYSLPHQEDNERLTIQNKRNYCDRLAREIPEPRDGR